MTAQLQAITDRPRWLSISAAAAWVGVSTKTIRRRIADGELPAYRCGGTIRVKTDDVEGMMHPIPSVLEW